MAKKVIDELVSVLGYEYDPKGLIKFTNGAKTIFKTTAKIAAGITASAVAGLAAVAGINRLTIAEERQAEAIGLSGQAFREWSGLAEKAGFDADIIADFVEEMNNKFGESKNLEKPLSAVTDSLKMLKLDFKDIFLLSPEKQFKIIGDAVLKLKDTQAGVSAADMLFGGEASKFFGFLRARGKSLDDQLKQQKENIFVTKEGADAARDYNRSLSEGKQIIKSIAQESAGDFSKGFGNFDEFNESMKAFYLENEIAIKTNLEKAGALTRKFLNFLKEQAPAAGKALKSSLDWLAEEKTQTAILDFLNTISDTIKAIVFVSKLIGKGLGKTGDFLFGTPTSEKVPGVPRKEGVVGSALDVSGNLFEKGVEGISKILTGTIFDPNWKPPGASLTAAAAGTTTKNSNVTQNMVFNVKSTDPKSAANEIKNEIKQMAQNTVTNSTSGIF